MCKISIIVPIYNMEKYLNRCIESILMQTFEDFELILVDDESNDASVEICKQYAKKDGRIRVICKKNGGVASARNMGLEMARGKFIMFCDSDDSIEPELFTTVYNTIERENVDSVVFNYTQVEDDKKKSRTYFEKGLFQLKTESDKTDYLIKQFMYYKHGYEVCTRIFKREIIEKYNIRFCLTCNNFAEDLGFVIKYLICSQSFYCLEESFYNYSLRKGSMMSVSKNIARLNELNEVAYDIEKMFKQYFSNDMILAKFCILHYSLMYNQYQKIIWGNNLSALKHEIRKITRTRWYKMQNFCLLKNYKLLKFYYGKNDALKIIAFSQYCLHGNWKLYCIESGFLYKIVFK